MNLPPSLDQLPLENPGFIGGGLAGFADRPMKRRRHLVADRTVRTDLIVIPKPNLAFLPCFVEAEEPVGVQARRMGCVA
jgi:hypothetical protein